MSRKTRKINDNIFVHFGLDHAIGKFLDITDVRYSKSGYDEQGEGYVFEHSDMFPTENDKVIIDVNEPITIEIITKACDDFIESLKRQKR